MKDEEKANARFQFSDNYDNVVMESHSNDLKKKKKNDSKKSPKWKIRKEKRKQESDSSISNSNAIQISDEEIIQEDRKEETDEILGFEEEKNIEQRQDDVIPEEFILPSPTGEVLDSEETSEDTQLSEDISLPEPIPSLIHKESENDLSGMGENLSGIEEEYCFVDNLNSEDITLPEPTESLSHSETVSELNAAMRAYEAMPLPDEDEIPIEVHTEEAQNQEEETISIPIKENLVPNEIVSTQSIQEIPVDNENTITKSIPENHLVDEPVPEVKKNHLNTYDINRLYIGFQTRVGLLVLGILVLFGLACYMIISTLQKNEVQKVDYIENSSIKYEVCKASDSSKCSEEDKMYYANSTSSIHINYHYEANFSEEIDHSLSYYVVVVHKIFDRFDSRKISYEHEDVLIENKSINTSEKLTKIDVNTELDYQKYYQFVNEYKKKYSDISNSSLSVIMYVDDGSTSHNVGEVVIPLAKEQFHVKVQDVKNSSQIYNSASNLWSNSSVLFIVVGCILVLVSLFLMFNLTKLVMVLAGRKSKYQDYLMFILDEYDRIIVNATDDYEVSPDKKLIKVRTFEELLEVRGVLNKPIIYSKINNVKSEFVVEDEEIVYKFVLKEADMGE